MNNKGADQTARMRRLICAFVVRIWHEQVFSWGGSYHVWYLGYDISKVNNEFCHSYLNWFNRNFCCDFVIQITHTHTTLLLNTAFCRPGAIGASRTVLKESNQQHQQRLYQSFDDYDFGDSDENNNAVTYRSGQFSKKKPVHSFPTSL